MSEILPLFQQIPEYLMVPLASPLKRTYWNVLMVAYGLHQSADQFEISRESLLDRVEEHLLEAASLEAESHFALDLDPAEIEPAELSELRLFAWRLLRQLERCGWFEYEYRRDLGQVLRFPDYALNLLAVLENIARGERPLVQGLAYNVKQILTDAEQARTDPGFVLYQAKNAVGVFVRELKSLKANIGRYVERALEQSEVRDLLALQMNDFWPKVFEPSYQKFKTSDNVLRFRLEILDRLEELSDDPLFVQEAAARVESQEGLDPGEAKARVYEWLEDMGAEIRALDGLLEEIDARHAHYVGLTLERIRHRLHRNESTETRLMDVIHRLHELPDSAEEIWEDLAEVFHLETLGEDSLYRMPHASEPHEPEPLDMAVFSEADRESLLTQMRESFTSPITKDSLFQEVRSLLEVHPHLELADLPMEDDLAFLRLIALHSYRNEKAAPYHLQIDEKAPKVRSGAYLFRNGQLTPREPAH